MKGTVFIFLIYFLNATYSDSINLTLRPRNVIEKKVENPKVTFVKRIVPHDYKSPPFEYDEKSRSVFVPKYRIKSQFHLDLHDDSSPKDESLKQPYKPFEGEDEIEKKMENPKVTFVKRIVPHDYKSPPFEYDEKSRSVFVPKYRIKTQFHLDLHEDLSPKDESLKQPFKAFDGDDDREDFETANDMVPGKDEETDLKPINRNVNEDNSNEYENPWQADDRIFGSRWHQKKKQHPRFGSLDELMTTIQTNGEYKRNPKAIYNIYSEGPVRQTVEKNPRHKKRNIKSYLVDDLVKKLQEAVQSPKNARHYSDDNKISSAESPSYAVFVLRNENTQPDNNINNLYEVLQNPLSAEFRQVSDELVEDNERPKKQNIEALKNVDALLDALEKKGESKVKDKTKHRPINAERKSLESDVSSNEASQRPIERPKTIASNKLEDLLQTLLGISERHNIVESESSKESSGSTEVEYPIDVIQKHKVQLMLPPLKSEKGKDMDPKQNLVMVVRNLGDLVKLWKHVQGVKDTKLRDRGTNSVVLEVDQPKVPGKPFNFPHYSIWNYWTYDKNLFHDNCPGEQAKVGDTCIWTPSHRK